MSYLDKTHLPISVWPLIHDTGDFLNRQKHGENEIMSTGKAETS